jgi:tetratricopeptide (TPR) repeat protein
MARKMTRSIARRPARVIAASLICAAAGALGPIPPRLAAQVPEATDVLDRTAAAAEASLRLGELQVAESHYRHALMHGWMMVGALHVAAGRLPDARQAFARASSSSVDNRIALQSLAIVQLQTGEGDQAIETLTRMASAAPRDVQLRLTLVQALVSTGKPEQAAQELDEAAGIEPDDPELQFALAAGYLRVRKVAAAEALFAKVAAARPTAETYVLIGRTYRDFQQYDRARAALQRALKMNPRVGRAHYYLGTSAILEEGVVRLDEAIAEFKKELVITPDDPLSTLRLGVVLVEARRYGEARPLLERSIKVPSPSYDAWLYLGRCQLAQGEAPAAVASLRRALDIAGRMPAAPGATDVRRRSLHYQLATALRATGETAEAERQFAEAQRLSVQQAASERDQLARFMADSGDAGAAGSLPLGIAGLDALGESERAELLKRVQAVLARAYLNLGIMQAQASRFGRAAEQLEFGASIDPEFPQLQYSLGVAYFNAAQYEKAVPALTRASEAQPQNADVRRMLAMALLNAGDYGKAADLLRTDPALPKDPSLQYAYGVALVRSNRTDEADKIFSRVLSEHPDVPELNVVIGQIHAARGDYDAAVAALRRALELRSTVPEANASLGDIYMRQGKLMEAAAALRAELAANPGNLQARHTLALVLDLDGKSDDALRELRTIVAARPNYADARYLFGKILLARGDANGALAHLEVAVRAAPDDPNIHYQLGQVYQRLGRAELAATAFENYQRLKAKQRGGAQ